MSRCEPWAPVNRFRCDSPCENKNQFCLHFLFLLFFSFLTFWTSPLKTGTSSLFRIATAGTQSTYASLSPLHLAIPIYASIASHLSSTIIIFQTWLIYEYHLLVYPMYAKVQPHLRASFTQELTYIMGAKCPAAIAPLACAQQHTYHTAATSSPPSSHTSP